MGVRNELHELQKRSEPADIQNQLHSKLQGELQNKLHSKLQSELTAEQNELHDLQKLMNSRVHLGTSECSQAANQMKCATS